MPILNAAQVSLRLMVAHVRRAAKEEDSQSLTNSAAYTPNKLQGGIDLNV